MSTEQQSDRIKELLEANNREVERRRKLRTTMSAIMHEARKYNATKIEVMANKALARDDGMASNEVKP